MGMAVKGATQHRLVGRALDLLLLSPGLDPFHRASAEILRGRVELALERIQERKRARALRAELRAKTRRTGEEPV